MRDQRPTRDADHGVFHIMLATMALGLFLFLLWLGMSVIHDSARNSAIIAFVLTLLFVYAVIRETAKRPRRG